MRSPVNKRSSITLHRSTSEAVVESLRQIFGERRYADKVIEKVLKQNRKWGSRDRRFIAETTYDIVRWYRYLGELAGAGPEDYWKRLAAWCIVHQVTLPSWSEFKQVSVSKVRQEAEKSRSRRVEQSIPDWMDELGEHELGANWDRELAALNEEAKVVLRVNTLKISREALMSRLGQKEIHTTAPGEFPEALILRERQNVFSLEEFKEGLFEIQDAASQKIAPFLRVEPGMRVVDACAGAGGKSLQLAALMKNKGRIIAMDVEQWKLHELQKRARRAGVTNLEARLIDSSKVIKRLEGSADRLLLDVPCSGIGVLRRNPDAKWKLSQEFITKVVALQRDILNDYSTIVRRDGILLYSTCSILPSENEHQVKTFLDRHQGVFEMMDEKRCWPSDGFDGFYMALLKRVG